MSRSSSDTSSSWVRNPISPSATIRAGRSLGAVSSQSGSRTSAPMTCALGVLGDHALSGGGDRGEVDVIPVHGGRGSEALESGVEPGAQVEPDGVGVAGQEPGGDLVQFLGSEGDVVDEVAGDLVLAVVVVEGADDLVGHGVAEDGMGPAVVEGSGAQRQPQAVLERREGRKRDGHWSPPWAGRCRRRQLGGVAGGARPPEGGRRGWNRSIRVSPAARAREPGPPPGSGYGRRACCTGGSGGS